jgi:hypothetical protein
MLKAVFAGLAVLLIIFGFHLAVIVVLEEFFLSTREFSRRNILAMRRCVPKRKLQLLGTQLMVFAGGATGLSLTAQRPFDVMVVSFPLAAFLGAFLYATGDFSEEFHQSAPKLPTPMNLRVKRAAMLSLVISIVICTLSIGSVLVGVTTVEKVALFMVVVPMSLLAFGIFGLVLWHCVKVLRFSIREAFLTGAIPKISAD